MVVSGWQPPTMQGRQSNKTVRTMQRGVVVATVFATNVSDKERMRLLLDRSVEEEPVPGAEGDRRGMEKSMSEEVSVTEPRQTWGSQVRGARVVTVLRVS